jgi:methionyl-tRNA formyltransferase
MLPKILFFGTENFGAAMLDVLIVSKKYDIIGVVTQPDRPVGRNQELKASPVKEIALKSNLTIFQPESLKSFDFRLATFDLSVVCQYGLIIPKPVLALPRQGTLNIHTSLLPKYRGASPIQTALLNGETVTGVTLMQMDEKMDHGAILAQATVTIDPDDTTETLAEKMKPIAAKLLIENVPLYLQESLRGTVQDESRVTTCNILSRDDGKLNFQRSATELHNQFRGLTPWPGVWTMWNGKRLKILGMKPTTETLPPGIVSATKNTITIGTRSGSIQITQLQLEGKKPVDATAFLAGNNTINKATLE